MKILVFYILIIVFAQSYAFANNVSITPIRFDFVGILNENETIIAYGDYGSMLISYDKGKSWEQKRAFEKGTIVKMFLDDDKLVVFSNIGKIYISSDKGKSWNYKAETGDSVYAAVKYQDGYFLRCSRNLFLFDKNLQKLKQIPFFTKPRGEYSYREYKNSIIEFDNSFIISNDSTQLLKYNNDLELTGYYSFSSLNLCEDCYYKANLLKSDKYLFLNIFSYEGKKIYKSENGVYFEKAVDCGNEFIEFLVDGDVIYTLDFNIHYLLYNNIPFKFIIKKYNINTLDSVSFEFFNYDITHTLSINDFILEKDKLYIAGNTKFLGYGKFDNNEIEILSDCSGFSLSLTPDKINDSTYLYVSGWDIRKYLNYIYITENNGLTFKPSSDKVTNPVYKDFSDIDFKYFDEQERILYMGGYTYMNIKNGAFISKDLGKSFDFKEVKYYSFNKTMEYSLFKKPIFPNIQKNNRRLILANNTIFKKIAYCSLLTYNENFDLVSIYRDSNYVIDHIIESKDTNSFFLHCLNMIDSTFEIKYTENKGKYWNIIKKYDYFDSLFYFKELSINNRKYLIIYYFSINDSICSIDALDISNKEIATIYKYKVKSLDYESTFFNAVDAEKDTIYIAVEDTLFYTTDMLDKSKWKYHLLPNNGRIKRTMKKFDDRFYVRYFDDNNSENIFFIQFKVSPVSIPIILADDVDFGPIDIKNDEAALLKNKIYNESAETELKITGISQLSNSVFYTDIPDVNADTPLIIPPNSYIEYSVYFKPTETKVYLDSLVFKTEADLKDNTAFFLGEGIDTTESSVEYSINIDQYLYSFKPYPIPATERVSMLVYWDTSLDMDTDDIAVYDIYGKKIAGRESITIDKQAEFKGIITWNCSAAPDGVYLLRITHGSLSQSVKVVVRR